MSKLFSGPVRTRVFWMTAFGAVASVVAYFGFDLAAYEAAYAVALELLVAVGALTGTTGTTEVAHDEAKGW